MKIYARMIIVEGENGVKIRLGLNRQSERIDIIIALFVVISVF